jgi:ATP/maltotriose-dependent transcriptional regulator MalT
LACARATKIARSLGETDVELLALALEGLALVRLGDTAEGMRRLDEATAAAVAGEIRDIDANVTACCYLITACNLVGDYDRAAQWCGKVREAAERFSYRFMFTYCRAAYAGVLMHHGAWAEAEHELLASIADLEATKPPMAADGVCHLAELRRRQGRLAEAAALYERAERPPLSAIAGPNVLLGRAALALDQGEPEQAADLAERYLRRVPPGDRAERVGGLELLVRALAAGGAVERARLVLDELDTAVTALRADTLQARASLARGTIDLAAGDLGTARRSLEDAVDGFAGQGLPYETARARLALAEALTRLRRHADARREARVAAATFGRLGATRDARRAETLLRSFPDAAPEPAGAAGLTAREVEVLRLVADGLSNEQIAERLVLSLRTVERHLSNIYRKLGASGRVARTSAATYAHTHGLTSPR